MTSPVPDIEGQKRKLRQIYLKRRAQIDRAEKAQKDEAISRALCAMPLYRQAKTVLAYVSTPHEVDTWRLIEEALADGKVAAVPYCVKDSREMLFYCIRSRDQLAPRTLGVLEPVPERCRRLTDFSASICICPGLAFDLRGYRLGYGGGYYDRFLSYVYTSGASIGLCYRQFLLDSLVRGRYDIPCGYLVTESGALQVQQPDSRDAVVAE